MDKQVFVLMTKIGRFETNPYKDGYRTFGFWSYQKPEVGDLVVKPHMVQRHRPTVWRILEVKKSFTGSNGEMWWTGKMMDLFFHKCITKEEVDTILAHPEASLFVK